MISSAAFSQGSWEKQETPTEEWLRSVYFLDSLHGWVAGHNGLILHTEDGGESWTLQQSNIEDNIVDIFFLDPERGWATAVNTSTAPFGTLVLKTLDGGMNWTSTPYPEDNIFMNCILFLDSIHGWMGGNPHALVRTNDGGLTWTQAQIDTATLAFFPVLKIEFYNDQYGYACGGMFDIAGVIWRTWDGGDHWYVIDVADAPADEVRGLHCFDSLHVMGAGGDPDFGYGVGLITTEDGGLNWEYKELGFQGNCYDLDFVTGSEAWAPLGPRLKFIYSTDGGVKWTEINTPDSTLILDVCFPDSLHGYAVGTEGAFLRYIPPEPVSLTEVIKENDPVEWNIYPNPIDFNARIQLDIKGLSFVRSSYLPINAAVRVYDMLGHEVLAVKDAALMTGKSEIPLQTISLDPGIYFCRLVLTSSGRILFDSGKMILKE